MAGMAGMAGNKLSGIKLSAVFTLWLLFEHVAMPSVTPILVAVKTRTTIFLWNVNCHRAAATLRPTGSHTLGRVDLLSPSTLATPNPATQRAAVLHRG